MQAAAVEPPRGVAQTTTTAPVVIPPLPRLLNVHCLTPAAAAQASVADLADVLLAAMQGDCIKGHVAAKDVLLGLKAARLLAVKDRMEFVQPGVLFNFVYACHTMKPFSAPILAHMASQVPEGMKPLYILSDIDNTLCPTRDPRYPKNFGLYPGQAALYAALIGSDASERSRLTFLTARFGEKMLPVGWLSKHERRVTLASLARLGMRNPSILFGSLRYCPYPTMSGINMAPMGAKKLINFKRLAALFPEYRYVFFGDSCEDDLRVGLTMLEDHPELMAAVFIHDFDGRCGKSVCKLMRKRADAAGLLFYTSTPDAALAAYLREDKLHLGVSRADVITVRDTAQTEVNAMPLRAGEEHQRAALQKAFALEIQSVNAVLGNGSTRAVA